MSNLEKEKTEIPCPGGGSPIRTTYGEVSRKSSLRSSRGHEYKFKSSDQSKLKRAMDKMEDLTEDYQKDMERAQKQFEKDMKNAQEDFGEAFQNVIGNADILLKR
ncbi:MAG: hypothetical protein QF814_06340 [Candidatus Marinimicrobia bacterium]|jgi:hypothetical protein|nr:hypothetical protein [Candidatus Neomarinimicrobiota bacterium]|tara:strand:- start:277 stop:591 length:315 start_codon:yes stop_codon:yes gene_type:complete